MKFEWQYQGEVPIKIKTFLGNQGVSHSLVIQAKFHGGDILKNGIHARTIDLMNTGDLVTLMLADEVANDVIVPVDLPIDILYEDQNYLIVNKPAGLDSVPAHRDVTDTLTNRVKGYLVQQHAANQVTHIVTRLDRDTSGIVIFAKHKFAHSRLDHQLKQHQLQKFYVAIVSGQLAQTTGTINLPIGREPGSFVKRMVRDDGKESRTQYWVIKRLKNATLVRVQLHTGRTHQIRVHFSAIGHPLIGDYLYGDDLRMQRQALHCTQVEFTDQFSGNQLRINCPLPPDFALTLETNQFG